MVSTLPPSNSREQLLEPFELRGGMLQLINSREREVVIWGPAGTGKTMGIGHWINLLAGSFPKMRWLMLRKTQTALTSTALVTFGEKVLLPGEAEFYGGSKREPASYRYRNGARVVVGGLDNADKILSSEYDGIYVNEVTELTLDDWEQLLTRLRNGVLKYPRIIGDCNPTYSTHWLLKRAQQGKLRLIESRLEDNPAYFDAEGNITPAGRAYVATLEALSGTRYQRFRLGQWVGVENAIYDCFNPVTHASRVLPPDTTWKEGAIGVDYGDVHPHAVVAVSRTTSGRLWVRETWTGRTYEGLVAAVGRMRDTYGIRRVRVDPMLKGWEKPEQSPIGGRVNRADASPGSRKNRIELVYRLFQGDALNLDPKGMGNDGLVEEIEAYHWNHRQTDTVEDLQVARVADDRVAALEYAIEELEGNPIDYNIGRNLSNAAQADRAVRAGR